MRGPPRHYKSPMKPASTTPPTAPLSTAAPRRRSRRWLAWLALGLVALVAWFWQPIRMNALTATSYGAHVGCSCRFIGGRALGDCRKDFEPGMGLVTLSEDEEARSVTARIPLLASQTATYREGLGCQLEPWDN